MVTEADSPDDDRVAVTVTLNNESTPLIFARIRSTR
jgi:hypothetical protein